MPISDANWLAACWRRVENVGATDRCWIWRGKRNQKGYGVAVRNGRAVVAHRVAYEDKVRPIPEGKLLCHYCDNPPCVRPDHLFVGTARDNTHDMMTKGRHVPQKPRGEFCKHGHALTPDNVYRYGDGQEQCRTCRREYNRRANAKRRSRARRRVGQ